MTEHSPFVRFLAPRSVAIVGASPQRGSPRNVVVTNLLKHGFPGNVYPVSASNDRNNGRRGGGSERVSGPRREDRRDFGRNTQPEFGRSAAPQAAAPRVEPFEPSSEPGKPPQTLHVYAYGVARN